ncbi:type II toxin-antitoxin system VapC family toxin [Accumulibacter sp.]|uniref:type II toxin-antitoxin system VapC family toxin n=1 Tax=Accumulibacter sp. TaxID=2053492 RepID=UPI0025FCBC39|nr:PIN domain-containing protein [Accumulibacter sp.]MCM8595739.1 PIN domain-containing protein [Accumulibacter sp.]MCM8625383.1 PIN domain-containing protein [Accumulibacter sp.]MDS4049886.1 PIN domain-containing protein [Accumulibacter sp.]
MSAPAYLLDTGIVLLATRDSHASKVIDAQFALSASSFRPALCEVSVGELLAFANANHWRDKRKAALMGKLRTTLIIPISHPGVHQCWADMQSALQAAGVTVGQNDLWIAATASVTGLTVLSTDRDFGHLVTRGLAHAVVVDPKTGVLVPQAAHG